MGMPQSIYDVCTDVGRGWKPGRVRRMLRALVKKYADVPKKRPFRCASLSADVPLSHHRSDHQISQSLSRYEGPPIGPRGLAIMRQWAKVPVEAFAAMPDNWVGSFGPGFEGAELAAAQSVERRPWRPVRACMLQQSEHPLCCADARHCLGWARRWVALRAAHDARGAA